MGEWESFTAYSTFGAQDAPLNLAIAPRGNVGGQGYAILESSRRLLDALGLPTTLWWIRLPVAVCAAVALMFFFVLAKRWFGSWSALAATTLLAVNPTFSQYGHELIILGPSLMAFVIFLERLQYLTRRIASIWAWIGMAASVSLVLLLYGPGRIMTITILGVWYVVMFAKAAEFGLGRVALVWRIVGASLISIALLVAIHPRNVRMLGPQLLFPHNAESVLITDSAVTLPQTVATNIQIALESLVLGGGVYHSTFLEATLIQGRYPLIPILIVPLMLAGVALATVALVRRRVPAIGKESGLLGLGLVTVAPMLLSSIFMVEGEDGPYALASLVNYRLAYALIPAYLFAAYSVSTLSARKRPWGTVVAAGLVVVLVAVGTYSLVTGRHSFEDRVAAMDPALSGSEGHEQWLEGYALVDRDTSWGSHFQQHLQYATWATAAAAALQPAFDSGSRPVIVDAPVGCFPEAPLKTESLGEIPSRNYHSVFLALYLADRLPGTSVGYVFVPPESEQQESLGEKKALWSARLHETAPGEYDYVDGGPPRIVSLDGADPDVVVVTTPTERNAIATVPTDDRIQALVTVPNACWSIR
jgi:hypothetical protein